MADLDKKTLMVAKLHDRRADKELMAILLLNQVCDMKNKWFFCVMKF